MKLGERIAAWRRSSGMLQEDLAAVAGVTQGAVSHWETGVANPEQDTLEQIVRRFGITMERFYGDLPSTPAKEAPRPSSPVIRRRKRST